MNLEGLTHEVMDLAREVGLWLKEERSRIGDEQIEVKGQGDFVSHADRHAEERITAGLTAMLPGSIVMAEEFTPNARGGEFRWIVDPLDGTANYLAGLPAYAVSVGLEDRRDNPEGFGKRLLGVVYVAGLDQMYDAWLGGGARKNGQTIRVHASRELKRSMIATAFPFRERHMIDGYLALFRDLYPKIADFRRIGAAAADLCWVADGTFDGYFEMDLKPWDLAAGSLIIEEAGGIVSDWWREDVLNTGWVACGTPAAYKEIMTTIEKEGFDRPEHIWR